MAKDLVVVEAKEKELGLVLPDLDTLKEGLTAVRQFQIAVKKLLIEDSDWGIIPGTSKPTLLKPGAEKITKLLKLADTYEILEKQEDWTKGFFRFLIRCTLTLMGTDVVVSSGLGECNSMEGKYRYRWVFGSDVPEHLDKTQLLKQERRSKKTGKPFIMYRLDNEDIYSQVNTLLKMAKKRSMVDAALSAGRLSDVFTQDMEDITPIAGVGGEPEVYNAPDASQDEQGTPQKAKAVESVKTHGIMANWDVFLASVNKVKWQNGIRDFILREFDTSSEGDLKELVGQLTLEQQERLGTEVKERLRQ